MNGSSSGILVVNVGSSSLKFGFYGADARPRWSGQFSGLEPGGRPSGSLAGQPIDDLRHDGHASAFDAALAWLVARIERDGVRMAAVAHRVVHGGDRFVAPCVLDAATVRELAQYNRLAPLHQPYNLAGVEAFLRALPDVPQIGCFDTAFHHDMPEVEWRLPLPAALAEQGLRRYGFHGLSYDYVSGALRALTPRAAGRCVLAHLGSGASLCATRDGRSVATSMGFSPLDGLVMGTRTGSLDPGVLLHLWREGWDLKAVERLLYRESGLMGLSGVSADMRTLRASPEPRARQAIESFTYRAVREIGAQIAILGGLDLLAFTGGIGENDRQLREDVATALAFAGVEIDRGANARVPGDRPVAVHAAGSAVDVWVVPTDEGAVAARGALDCLAQRAGAAEAVEEVATLAG